MNQPVLSIDVAKGKSVAAAFLSYHDCMYKPFSFIHTNEDLHRLFAILEQMKNVTDQEPKVVLEATGNYSKPLVSFFSSHGYSVVLLNPIPTHQLKQKAVRKIKTDPIDAIRIAHVFYFQSPQPQVQLSESIQQLRVICRQSQHWMGLYGETQLHFRAVLDLLFPGYDKAFHKVCNRTSLELLSRFPTPSELLAAEHEEIITLLLSNRRGRAWNESKLQELLEIARHSLPDLHAIQAQRVVLMQYIHLLKTYQDCMSDLLQTMQTLAESIEIYHLLRTIPGVGPLTAAMLIAEIGDIKRFPSVKQLAAFAGLDSAVHESGTFKSKKNRISKRGSQYLRTALYQATVAAISKQIHGPRNSTLFQFYQQKRNEGKPAKVAIVATSHKLLRIIFGMWNSGRAFQAG
ncbi:Transposase [Paenibacillus uliginis N3/975]|uniref:Transposase n=1 Tax=Paenibacillus uliginis N3/975 TaxID=1313296 RepID=A0A1X7H425_9BACL|nr:IS110 family transposase [Paenibacillus uliginis]SMF79036.1 Transposase [Paenibacillus uliginis N3/975]